MRSPRSSAAPARRGVRRATTRAERRRDGRARLRRPADAGRATCCATTRRCAATSSGRFRCILIDEFQDTDPIQVEIAMLPGERRPGRRRTGAARAGARPALRRRRPEAVDLPLPPRRHRDLRRGQARAARRRRGADPPELPLGRGRHRLGQPRLRPALSRRRASSPANDAAAPPGFTRRTGPGRPPVVVLARRPRRGRERRGACAARPRRRRRVAARTTAVERDPWPVRDARATGGGAARLGRRRDPHADPHRASTPTSEALGAAGIPYRHAGAAATTSSARRSAT